MEEGAIYPKRLFELLPLEAISSKGYVAAFCLSEVDGA
tara:strand:+ start:15 stop:128 length:114 start_codon:yes stop_codon:yes gene_type:complete